MSDAKNHACSHCECGKQIMGKFGSYCFECGTYNPTGIADEIAEKYFEALQAGQLARVAEIKLILDYCERETIRTAQEQTVPRKTTDGKTEYFCRYCQAWTRGILLDLTGYTDLICGNCDFTLKADYYGYKDIENEPNPG